MNQEFLPSTGSAGRAAQVLRFARCPGKYKSTRAGSSRFTTTPQGRSSGTRSDRAAGNDVVRFRWRDHPRRSERACLRARAIRRGGPRLRDRAAQRASSPCLARPPPESVDDRRVICRGDRRLLRRAIARSVASSASAALRRLRLLHPCRKAAAADADADGADTER
jgi:hypothetical protein